MNSFVTPRPVPQFNFVNTFSTKKERTLPGQPNNRRAKRAPPTPTPIVSAYYSCPGPQKAHTISFKNHNSSSLTSNKPSTLDSSAFRGASSTVGAIQSPLYNESRKDTYFRQAFEIEANIGSGSFGDVFRVRCKEDGRMYAVKRSRFPFRGPTDRKEKLEEVRKMESLPHHPNCVRFYRAWEENQFLYIQLELCRTSLNQIAESEHELPEPLIWDYMIDLLLAIQHLHDNDLIHLDVKPENILLSMDGVCKLCDFGLVFNLKENLEDAREGDSKYLAPEVLSGIFSKKADIFSLGVTLLELACDLDLPTNGTLWHDLRQGSLPSSFTKHLSKEFVETVKLMMNPDPSFRPSAAQLLAHPYLRHRCRWRRLRLAYTRARLSASSAFFAIILHLFMFLLFLLLPLRALARKWSASSRRNNAENAGHSTPVYRPAAIVAHDFSFSDDEVSDLSSAVISGNDSTLGRPLNDSSPLPINHSMDHHRNDEQPLVSSTPLVLRGGRSSAAGAAAASSRRPSLRRSIFSNGGRGGSDLLSDEPSNALPLFPSPNKPIPRKLNDYFDAIASDSD